MGVVEVGQVGRSVAAERSGRRAKPFGADFNPVAAMRLTPAGPHHWCSWLAGLVHNGHLEGMLGTGRLVVKEPTFPAAKMLPGPVRRGEVDPSRGFGRAMVGDGDPPNVLEVGSPGVVEVFDSVATLNPAFWMLASTSSIGKMSSSSGACGCRG